jgi:hypothetical protein
MMASHVIEVSCDHKSCDLLSHQAYIIWKCHVTLKVMWFMKVHVKYKRNLRKIRKILENKNKNNTMSYTHDTLRGNVLEKAKKKREK